MYFTKKELSAILLSARVMMKKEGREDSEWTCISKEFRRFGLSDADFQEVTQGMVEFMPFWDEDFVDMFNMSAAAVIREMTDEEKIYVSGFLIAVLMADGYQDDSEYEFWNMWCTMCRMPKHSARQAYDYWLTH